MLDDSEEGRWVEILLSLLGFKTCTREGEKQNLISFNGKRFQDHLSLLLFYFVFVYFCFMFIR